MNVILITAATVSFALTPLVKRIAVKLDAVSRPDMKRKTHARPIAQWGGLAVYLAILASIAAGALAGTSRFGDFSLPLMIAVSGGLLCLVGAYDDLGEIRARWKLLGQIVAVAPVIVAGHYFEGVTLFGHCLELGSLGAVATMAWMILAINALNLIDGIDGLASVIGITMAAAVGLIAAYQGQATVMMMSLVVAAALSGFALHNFPPAKIYLGDCGSMLIGFVLALLAMQVSLDAAGNAKLTVLAVLFFVPLLDTALAVLRRTMKGQNFTVADREHVHHRLLDRGLSPGGTLLLMGMLALLGGLDALMTATTQREILAWLALGGLLAVLVNRRIAGHEEWSIAKLILLRGLAFVARRPAALHRPMRSLAAMPKLHWKIVSAQESRQPAATSEAVAVGKNTSWEQPDNKAA